MKIEIGDYVEIIKDSFVSGQTSKDFYIYEKTKAKVLGFRKKYPNEFENQYVIIEFTYWVQALHADIHAIGNTNISNLRLIHKGVIKDVSGFETLFNSDLT